MLRRRILCATLILPTMAWTAAAATVEVLPGDPNWVSTGNSGGGSSTITDTFADQNGGNGSLELTGDRTRFEMYQLAPDGFGLLSQIDSYTFEWAVAPGSTSNLGANYTPAIRLLIEDPAWATTNQDRHYTELIWEGAYNSVGTVTQGTWYTTSSTDDFWRWEGGVTRINGTTLSGAQANLTISEWDTGSDSSGTPLPWYSDSAYVYGISIGVGSSVGAGYHAFADYLTLVVDGVSTTYDFETAVVPVPPAAALGLLGMAMFGLRRRARRNA